MVEHAGFEAQYYEEPGYGGGYEYPSHYQNFFTQQDEGLTVGLLESGGLHESPGRQSPEFSLFHS